MIQPVMLEQPKVGQLQRSYSPVMEIADPHLSEAYKQFRHRLTQEYRVCERPEDKSVKEIEALLHMKQGETN